MTTPELNPPESPSSLSPHPLGLAFLEWCQPECILKASNAKHLGNIQASDPAWQQWMGKLLKIVDEISAHPQATSIINTRDDNGHHALIAFSRYQKMPPAMLKEECWRPIYDKLFDAGLNPIATSALVKFIPRMFSENLRYIVKKVVLAASEGSPYLQEEGGNLFHSPPMLVHAENVPPGLAHEWLTQKRSSDGCLPLHQAFRDWIDTKGTFPDYVIVDQFRSDLPRAYISVLSMVLKMKICSLAMDYLESKETPTGPPLYDLVIQTETEQEEWTWLQQVKNAALAMRERDQLIGNTPHHKKQLNHPSLSRL